MQRIDLGTRYVYVPEEFCPCAPCWELDPCECPPSGRLSIYGNVGRKFQTWDQDTSGVGNTWYTRKAEKGVIGTPTDTLGVIRYPYTIGANNANTTYYQGDILCQIDTSGGGNERVMLLDNSTVDGWNISGGPVNTNVANFGDYNSYECDPDKWGYSQHVLFTTRNNLVHVPDSSTPVEDCCDPAYTNHPCPPAMKMTFGGYEMHSLATIGVSSGTTQMTFVFQAGSEELPAYLPTVGEGLLQNGFALTPGYGPSVIPNPTIGTPYEEAAFVTLSATVVLNIGGALTPGANITNIFFQQNQPTSTFLGPSLGYATDVYANSFTSPTPFVRNTFINSPPGGDACDLFPLNINVPLWSRKYDPGVPGYVVTSLGSVNLNLQFATSIP